MSLAQAPGFVLPLGLAVLPLTGRLHVAHFGPKRLARLGPFEAASSAALGLAWWTVGLAAGSAWGLRVDAVLWAALAIHAVALGAVHARRRWAVLRPSGPLRTWAALLFPLALAGAMALVPLLRHGRFATENDSLLYCSLAQWYEDHPFGEAVGAGTGQPLAHYAAVYREAGYPLGPALLLAGTSVLARARSPVLVYPAWSACGLLVALAVLLTAGRRVLRWPRAFVLGAGLGLAALLQPLTWAHHLGFLAQTFAVGLLLAALLQLSAIRSASRRTVSEALLASLLAASLAVTYPPLVVVLAGGFAAWLAEGWLAGKRRGLVRFVALTALGSWVLVGAAGLDLHRAFRFLGGTQVGGHVDLSPWGYAEAALGAWFWSPFGLGALGERFRAAQAWLAPLLAWLAWRGLRRMAGERAGRPWLGALGVLAAAFLWYALMARDPWTGGLGHTWNLFKLTQWAFPFAALAVLHGLSSLGNRRGGRALGWALGGAVIALLPAHLSFADRLGRDLEAFVGSPRPLAAWEGLRERFLAKPRVFVAADLPAASTFFLPTYLGLLAYPSPMAGDWQGALWIPPDPESTAPRLLEALARGERTDHGRPVIPVVTGLRGYRTDAVESIGGAIGFVKEPGPPPRVLAVLSASEEADAGGCRVLLAPRARVLIFAARETTGRLRLVTDEGVVERVVTLAPGASRLAIDLDSAMRDRDSRACLRSVTFEAEAPRDEGSDQNAPPLTSSFGSQGASDPPR